MQYSKKVLEVFMHPKNTGEIENADGVGKVGNLVCGDLIWVYIKVGKDKKGKEIIKDIKYKTFGCVAAVSSSEILCNLVKGKTLAKAKKISKEDIISKLGKLPKVKYHCSVLAADGLRKAIDDYEKRKSLKTKMKKE